MMLPARSPTPSAPSNRPKTSTRSSVRTPRWMSVKPETSSTELLTPVTNRASEGDPRFRPCSDQDERQAPRRQCDRDDGRQSSPARQAERPERTDQPTQADRGVQQPDSCLAHAQEPDRRHDDERDEQAAHEDLCDEGRHEERRRRIPLEQTRGFRDAKARRAVVPGTRPGVSGPLEPNPCHDGRRTPERCGNQDGSRGRPGGRDDDAGEQRPEERAQALAEARGDVRRHELARASRERRQERGLDRADESPGAGDERNEHERRGERQLHGDHQRGQQGAKAASEVDDRQDTTAAEALDEHGCERRGDDRGQNTDCAEDTHPESPRRVVRNDEHEDEEGPVGGCAGRPGDLEASDRRVRKRIAQHRRRRPPPESLPHRAILAGAVSNRRSSRTGRSGRYIRRVNLRIALVVVVVLGIVIFVSSVVQNEGCMPWKEPVGTQGSPFAGTEDNIKCR